MKKCSMRYQNYPKRDLIRNYFPVPNEVFVLSLSPGELAVYCYLLFCEDRATYQCWPSFQTIGKATCMSRSTVSKHVKSLESRGFITKVGQNRNGTLHPFPRSSSHVRDRRSAKRRGRENSVQHAGPL